MKVELNIRKSGNIKIADLRGQMTVACSKELSIAFQKMRNEKVSQLEIDKPLAIDLCFVQLLWSLITQFKDEGHRFSVVCNLNEADQKLFNNIGFSFLTQSANETSSHL